MKKNSLSPSSSLAYLQQNLALRALFSLGALTGTTAGLYAEQPSSHHAPTLSSAEENETLRLQLLETTRQLNEYKAHLFRSSHPQDLAKINSLKQQIAEREAINYKLTKTLSALEKEILHARKQASTLEITADALSAMVQAQRLINESQEKEYIAKSEAIAQELQAAKELLATEKEFTLKVNNELRSANESLAAYEQRLQELETGHAAALANTQAISTQLSDAEERNKSSHEELHVALRDLENSKNSLVAELGQLKQELESRVSASESLKVDLAEALKRQESHQKNAQRLENDLQDALLESTILKFQLADLREKSEQRMEEQSCVAKNATDNLNHLAMSLDHSQTLQEEREASQLLYQNALNQMAIEVQEHKKLLNEKLLEKEEALSAAVLYYQVTLEDLQKQQQALQEAISQAESHNCHLQSQLETLQNSHAEVSKRAEDLQAENQSLHTSYEEQYQKAREEHAQLSLEHSSLKNDLTEKEVAFTSAALNYLSMLDDYRRQVSAVEDKLSHTEQQLQSLQQDLDHISTLRMEEKTHLETLRAEKEQLNAIYKQQQAEALALQEKIDQERLAFENDLLEKERILSAASIHYIATLDDYRQQVESVEDRLAQAETHRDHLKSQLEDSHKTIQDFYQQMEQWHNEKEASIIAHSTEATSSQAAITELKAEILNLQASLSEKEGALHTAQEHTSQVEADYQVKIAAIESALENSQKQSDALKNQLEEAYRASQDQQQLADSFTAEKQHLQNEIEALQAKLQDQQEHSRSDVEAIKAEIAAKDQALKTKEDELLSLKANYQAQIQEVEGRVTEAHAHLERTENELKDALAQVEQEKQRNEASRKELENAASAIAEFQAAHEKELKTMEESIALLKEQHTAEKEVLEAKLEQQQQESQKFQQHLQALARKQAASSEKASELEDQLNILSSQLESKDHDLMDSLAQVKSFKQANDQLHAELAEASHQSSRAEEQLAALRVALATTQTELTNYQLAATVTIEKLQAQTRENSYTIATLTEENKALLQDLEARLEARRQESEKQLHAFSSLVDRQESSLTDAGEALQKANTLNSQLAQENARLKDRIAHMETAERSINSSKPANRKALAPLIAPRAAETEPKMLR